MKNCLHLKSEGVCYNLKRILLKIFQKFAWEISFCDGGESCVVARYNNGVSIFNTLSEFQMPKTEYTIRENENTVMIAVKKSAEQ